MQEPTKFCQACGQQNNLSAQFCQKCGLRYTDAPPPQTPAPEPKITRKHTGLWVFCGIMVLMTFALIGRKSEPQPSPAVGAGATSSPRPTPTSFPVLPPAERLAEAKKLLARPYNLDDYNQATLHLASIPEEAKEYKEAQRIFSAASEKREREEAANDPQSQLVVIKSRWERGGFGAIAMWYVTFRNNSNRPIGDIQYRTAYYSETGNLVDKGGIDSLLDKKIIQKVIPAKSTRTIEVNDGFVHSEAHRAQFQIVDCKFATDSR